MRRLSSGAPSGHSRLTVAGVFSPSTTNSASIAAVVWWRLRQPSFQTFAALVLPAEGVAGEQQLEGLGEAGLAGAVAADDEGQAGAGREVEGRRLADAAEAFDGDGLQVRDPRRGLLGVAAP